MGNLSKFKLVNIVRSKIRYIISESLNKRLVSFINQEQEVDIESLMFLRNVTLNLELNV